MDEKDLPSCSDDSDADFVPKEEECNSDSGSEVSDYEGSEGEENTTITRKRKKRSKRANKKAKTNKSEEEEEEEEETNETKEKEIDVDALWADFKKDVNSSESKKTTNQNSSKVASESGDNSKESSESSAQKQSTINKLKSVPSLANKNRVGGLSSVLNKIGKKDKMSTLQKSQLDWNNFKKSEGIEEEIKLYNKGKDGYLDKQDFLQRTDLRQFEIEKDLRTARRKF